MIKSLETCCLILSASNEDTCQWWKSTHASVVPEPSAKALHDPKHAKHDSVSANAEIFAFLFQHEFLLQRQSPARGSQKASQTSERKKQNDDLGTWEV